MSATRPSLTRVSTIAATSAVLAASVVLSGCSSGTSGPVTSVSGASSSVTSSSVTSAAGAATSSSTSSSGAVTKTGGGLAIGGGFCRDAAVAQAAQTKTAGAFGVGSTASLKKIEQQGLAALHSLAATAPSAIKGSLTVIVATDEKLYAALAAADFDVRKVDPSVLSGVNTPAFTQATQTIENYLMKTCGLSVSPSS